MEGAGHTSGGIPVSVKTRLGYNADILEEWLPKILGTRPAAVTIHARTRKDMSKVPARWERVKNAVEIRDSVAPHTRIIGNGDALSIEDAQAKALMSGADGVMVGRALFGNPWFFHPTRCLPYRLTALPTHGVNRDTIVVGDTGGAREYVTLEERLSVLVEHTKLFEELLPHKSFAVMKKHFKAYVSGFDGAHELRGKLMETENAAHVEAHIKAFLAIA
jgi:tRNA-dihydrouridine synthase